jgi:hypothetical protein
LQFEKAKSPKDGDAKPWVYSHQGHDSQVAENLHRNALRWGAWRRFFILYLSSLRLVGLKKHAEPDFRRIEFKRRVPATLDAQHRLRLDTPIWIVVRENFWVHYNSET